jgi:hypothetical protein
MTALPVAIATIALTATVALSLGSGGWDNETCGEEETRNGGDETCTLFWCVNASFAYYNCPISTSKECPEEDCDDN